MSQDPPKSLSGSLDINRLPTWAVLLLALTGTGTGLGALGLRFGDPDPPAKAAEVADLREEVADLKAAVQELGFQIRLHHQE